MTRTLTVSTEVFAAIWGKRQVGEETEDAILRRILGCSDVLSSGSETRAANAALGVHDARNNIEFPEGFEIFREYKRNQYFATASAGFWVRSDNGEKYPTLNQLNSSIVSGAENAWNGSWRYRAPDGSVHSVNELRQRG